MIIENTLVLLFFLISILFVIASINSLYYSVKLWLHYKSMNINKHDILTGKGLGPIEKLQTMNDRMNNIFYNDDPNDDETIKKFKLKLKRSKILFIYIVIVMLLMFMLTIFVNK